MITEGEARILVERYMIDLGRPDLNLLILEDQTLDLIGGWVFFYTTEQYRRTRDPRFLIGGNAPLLVEKESGSLHELGTARPLSAYLKPYERKWCEGTLPSSCRPGR